jgi:hypothetical protein
MSSRKPGRATLVAVLPPTWHTRIAIVVLLVTIACLVFLAPVLAYRENMFELAVASNPPTLVQNQSYSTSTTQNLFHTATNAVSDTEAFEFSDTPPAGINLAQTSSLTAVGTESEFFSSTASSDMVPRSTSATGSRGHGSAIKS